MQNQNNETLSSIRFLATTLHEIRTPIQTIIGESELLSNTNLDQEQKEYVRQIQFGAEALLSLANNILDYSKITHEDFKLKNAPLNIIELVEKSTDFISLEAFNKGLEIVTDIDNSVEEEIIGDSVRIQQILLNLIKNAVKFTTRGFVLITVNVESDKKNLENNFEKKSAQKFLTFKIIDTGIGIQEKSAQKLFTAYYQADSSSTRNFEGTGLGLAISKSLINAMNGQIGVTENKPNGSIFYFKIPYLPVEKNDDTKNNSKDLKLVIPPNTKILIVDDSQVATQSLKNDFIKFGITNIFTASTAQEAIEMMKLHAKKNEPFTDIFIDLILPKVDGWHLAAVINDDTEINSAKLFLLVPEGQMGGEARMKMLNWFDGYIYKPIKRQKLFELLSQNFQETFENAVLEQRDPSLVLEEKENPKKKIEKNYLKIQHTENEENIAKNLKILVTEDHPVNRKIITNFLKKFGATVFEAENGKEAISIISAHPEIEFIFMDILMPLVSGIEATEKIRKFGFKGIIIACTANSDEEDFFHYKQIGMNDILIKPFKSQSVKEIINKWNSALKLSEIQNEKLKTTQQKIKKSTWNEEDFLDTISSDYCFGKQLITDFINQTDNLILQIPDFIKTKNYDELRRIGHTITGSSSTVSAFLLSEYGTKLNKAAKTQNQKELNIYYNSICKEIINLKKNINQWILKNELHFI